MAVHIPDFSLEMASTITLRISISRELRTTVEKKDIKLKANKGLAYGKEKLKFLKGT
jgi:hypothetical protein